MYVGGKFTAVQRPGSRPTATSRISPRSTATPAPGSRPSDRCSTANVWDLKITDDGDLLVAGQFHQRRRCRRTPRRWRASISPPDSVDPHLARAGSCSPARPSARSCERSTSRADDLYRGWQLHPRSPASNGVEKQAGRIARVSLDHRQTSTVPSSPEHRRGRVRHRRRRRPRVHRGQLLLPPTASGRSACRFTDSPRTVRWCSDLEPWVRTYVREQRSTRISRRCSCSATRCGRPVRSTTRRRIVRSDHCAHPQLRDRPVG